MNAIFPNERYMVTVDPGVAAVFSGGLLRVTLPFRRSVLTSHCCCTWKPDACSSARAPEASKPRTVGTVTVRGGEEGLNSAVTVLSAVIVRVQEAVPEQSPCQPVNTNPRSADAVRTTLVPPAKLVLQVWPQLMPDGLLVTLPDPEVETESRWVTEEALKSAATVLSAVIVRV